jgi:hypothetical protein
VAMTDKEKAKYIIEHICPYCLEADCYLWEDEEEVLKCPI